MDVKKRECMYRGGVRRDFTSTKFTRLFLLAVCSCKSQYMYEYIIETESLLSELKTFPNCKET